MKNKSNISDDEKDGFDINSDENLSGSTHLNDPLTEESEIEKLKMELTEVNDKYLRKVAEFDNFRKRNNKEKMDLIMTAGKDVIVDMLEILDDCDRAQKEIEKLPDLKEMKDGVLLIFNKLRTKLHNRGLKPMESLNQEFNPDYHEAITEIPAPTEDLKGKILDVMVEGFYLNDKIIRHAKVVVGK